MKRLLAIAVGAVAGAAGEAVAIAADDVVAVAAGIVASRAMRALL